tara:strand:- start:593 stop:1201 length:609 start_codon:yes stop_codon:yes gene_type:complete
MVSKIKSSGPGPLRVISGSAAKDPVSRSASATAASHISVLEHVQPKAVSTLPARSEYAPFIAAITPAQRAAQERAEQERQQREAKFQRAEQQASRQPEPSGGGFNLKTPGRSAFKYVPPNNPTLPQIELGPEKDIPRRIEPGRSVEPVEDPRFSADPLPQAEPQVVPAPGPAPLPSEPETYFPWWWLVVAAVTTHILFKKGK